MGRQLDYEQTKRAVMLTLLAPSYRVPMIMGDRGCGKTALAWDIANELDANFINIDANVLKEGEIGGIPTITKYKDAKGQSYSVTEYATYTKLQDCRELYDEDPEKLTILFIDEFNRCDNIVKREIMNLVLNREINGYVLPDNVHVVCACNPSSSFENYRDTDYQVEEMDEAQLDRFEWIEMRSDIVAWMKWALKEDEDGISNIDKDIIEYLADRENFLNNITSSKEDIKTSPRSWESVSDTLRTFRKTRKKYKFTDNDLLNAISGDIGLNIASDFIGFLEDNKNPIIKPEKIFEGESFENGELCEHDFNTIMEESILRKNILAHNCLSYIKREFIKETENGKKLSKKFLTKELLFIEILTKAISNKDLMYSILLDLNMSNDNYDKKYLKHIIGLKNIDILDAFSQLNQAF